MVKVVVVTPVLNQLFYTKMFLRSLEQQTFKDFAVIVVNNASTDESASWLEVDWAGTAGATFDEDFVCSDGKTLRLVSNVGMKRFVVQNPTNRGYAGGCNDGLSVAQAFYPEADVLITNNDMELFPECIAELVKAAESVPNAGVIGGRLLFPDGRIQHAGALIGVFGWGQHKLAGVPSTEFVETKIEEQEYVTGALFYLTNRCLRVVPYMDERFNPAYFEEVDYCTTARSYGFRTYYQPSARAVHYENKTANATFGSPEAVSDLSRFNQLKYYMKHDADVLTYRPTSERKALITGKIYGDWSFSIVLRNLAKSLKRNGVDVAIAPEEYHQPMPVDDWEIKEMIQKPHDYWDRVVMRSSEGDHQYLMPPGLKRVAHTTFEGTHPPQRWVEQLNHVDEVVVNSKFCKGILIDRGVRTSITVVPNPVDTTLFNPQARPLDIEGRRKFGFLAMSAYGERKNLEMIIKAFILEFKPSEDVFLSMHSLSLFYILQQARMDLKTWVANIMGGQELPHAPIYVTSNSLHPTAVPSMITAHQCGIFPSKCEGFGNFLIEAAACGIPCIATDYSGMSDFISDDVGYKLAYKLQPMPLQVLPYFRNYVGSQWAEPELDHLRFLLRYAYEHPNDVQQKGVHALKKSSEYDIIPVGRKLARVLFDG